MNRAQRRNTAKSRDPKDLATLAESHHRNGRLHQAEQNYREAIALNPAYLDAHNNLGVVLREAGRLAEATAQFVHTVKLCPTDVRAVFNLARALSAQNQPGEADLLYRQAISLAPQLAEVHFGFAVNLVQLGQHDEAELSFLKTLQIDPFNWQARIHLGHALVAQEKAAEAGEQIEILARAAETAPDFPYKNFGVLLVRANCSDAARACFQIHLARHPADSDEITMLLATVGGALPERASDRHIAEIYAARAHGWDKGSAGPTGYQGHRLVAAAIEELSPGPIDTIIDAGCGTGLVGELIRARTRNLIGIDMSEPMLAQARQKKIYDVLHRGDLLDYFGRHPDSSDIIASAATLIHFGDLDPVFEAAAKCLRPNGLLVCTLFPNDDDPDNVAAGTLNGLAQGGCFRHGSDYVTRTAGKHGFGGALLRRAAHEYIGGSAIEGLVVGLRLTA